MSIGERTRPADAVDEQTLSQALRTPRSFGYLLIALIVACTFAALGQWQLQRATQAGTVVPSSTESIRPLSAVATPQAAQTSSSIGQLVTTRGSWVAGDYLVIADRLNHGSLGYWVTGHFLTEQPAGAQLAVAVGWTSDRARAESVADRLNSGDGQAPVTLTGRYVDSDSPDADTDTQGDDGSAVQAKAPALMQDMAVSQLINTWKSDLTGPVYNGYVTDRHAARGLTAVYSPTPTEDVELNLLNLFYAAEWALFAVVAFYIWYRVIRDRWEADMDAAADASAQETTP